MALMNCKLAIVYTSVTGNTEEVASILYQASKLNFKHVSIYPVNLLPRINLEEFDAVLIGTYTWGNGVFGTGDSFYPDFCGAVDEFRNMLYAHTTLAATLKIELMPQVGDLKKCYQFVGSIANRLNTLLV
jgi:flavodoxin I